ncbi:MAG: PLDc N-terminal domain-containing protein, partial [Microbacteriaceae bacterium]
MDSITISTIVVAGAIVLDITIRVLAVIFIPMNRKPQTATAWLLAIFLIPYLGIIVFLAIGRTKLPRRRRIKQDKVNEMIRDSAVSSPAVVERPGGPEWLPSMVALNRNLGAMPLLGGNSAALHDNYAEGIAAMTAAVDGAQSFVHV